MSKVLFDHIAMAIPRMADAPAVLAGVLGGVPADGASSPVFNWGVWRFEAGGDLEILEPRGPDGFVHRFLAARGPGIHHVTFRVPSLAEERVRPPERHRRWRPPLGPANPPPPVRILGLRMSVRSREAARHQWEEVLLGESEPGENGSLIYRWPGSPMRLVVEIDATAEEGPVAIEYTSHHELTLPAHPHQILGARVDGVRL